MPQFLGWDRPLADMAAEKLLEGLDPAPGRPADLSDTLLITPTKGAARAVKEKLGELAAKKGAGLFPPTFWTADRVALAGSGNRRLATEMEMNAAWAVVLSETDPSELQALFPSGYDAASFGLVFNIAQALAGLRRQLGENGLGIREAAEKHADKIAEPDRWAAMARLEELYLKKLADGGLEDPETVKSGLTRSDAGFEGFNRIILAFFPDPLPLVLARVRTLSKSKKVEAWVGAEPGMEPWFDEWGGPRADKWLKEGEKLFGASARPAKMLCANSAAELARTAANLVKECRDDGGRPNLADITITIPNEKLYPELKRELARVKVTGSDARLEIRNPSGEPFRNLRTFRLLSPLKSLLLERTFDAAARMARHPDYLRHIQTGLESDGKTHTEREILGVLDDFRRKRIPESWDAALALSKKSGDTALAVLGEIEKTVAAYKESPSAPAFIRRLFNEVFKGTPPDETSLGGVSFQEEADEFNGALAEMEGGFLSGLLGGKDDCLRALEKELSGRSLYPEGNRRALETTGWLEAPWMRTRHTIVAGVNEEHLPGSSMSDVFLPDSLREAMGMRCDKKRFARDAFMLKALAESKKSGGKLFLAASKFDVDGKPLRPSRLLFLCDDKDELKRRFEIFFSDAEAPARPEKKDSEAEGFLLRPDLKAAGRLEKISVTDFRAYLENPLAYFFERVLRMDSVDYAKHEMDAMDFGTFIHAAIEKFSRRRPSYGGLTWDQARAELMSAADETAREKYGDDPPPLVTLQIEAAKQRLNWVAKVFSEQDSAWELLALEHPLGGEGVEFGGTLVRGKIDRIEINRARGLLRILDYKTSDSAESPDKAHYKDKKKEWTDLQLPLYALLLPRDEEFKRRHKIDFEKVKIQCAYLSIPKSSALTKIDAWEGLDELLPDAEAEALRVIAEINEMFSAGKCQRRGKLSGGRFKDLLVPSPEAALDKEIWEGA